MSLLECKKQVLAILVENLNNAQPQAVDSNRIAERLNLPVKEACQVIKILNKMGVVESDPEGERALITRAGLLHVS